ncbi:MAG TPA: chromate transporter [Candidatus Binataceae bacterium]|jgi:chromate transporter|nr:chromate transporter [Candidatus Binataceae bacterium]
MNDAGAMNDSIAPARARPQLRDLFKVFLTAGAVSFGGGVLAYLREYLVRHHRWLEDDDFLDALEVSETLPGLNSVNMSVIVGDRMRGAIGAAVAVTGLMLPGMIVMMTLGVIWEQQRHNLNVGHFLVGVAASAVGLLLTVTLQLGHKQFVRPLDLILIAVTFVAVSVFKISLGWVLLLLGPIAIWLYRPHGAVETAERFAHLRERFHSHRSHWRH